MRPSKTKPRTILRYGAVLTSSLVVLRCTDAVAPGRGQGLTPSYALDQVNGTLGESGRRLIKGFNPTNPHHGDAIVATFVWKGSTNVIDSVTDCLAQPGFPRVGNKYRLVEYVTAGGMSMATYVAINVQNFPDANSDPAGDSTLAVAAHLSDSVTGGVALSSYTGVSLDSVQALRAHQSASGTASVTTNAHAGPVATNAGEVVYTATLSMPAGLDAPSGFNQVIIMSDTSLKVGTAAATASNSGMVDPQWTWYFSAPRAWLASTLVLDPPPPPPPPLVVLDQWNGTFNESGTSLAQGFDPTNPHVGDAIVATFYWIGSTNVITSVTDHLSSVGSPLVGNEYHLVDYATAGGRSMATYVATNVQNFPDGYSDPMGDSILVVRADLSDSVSGGLSMAAFSGVAPTLDEALGMHRWAFGSTSDWIPVAPGAIAVGAGALVFGTTVSDELVGLDAPSGYASFIQSDGVIKGGAAFSVAGSAGSANPPWTWYFNGLGNWIAAVVALNPPSQ